MYSANKCWLITFYVPGPGPTLCGRHKTHQTSSRNFTPLEGPGMHNEIQNVVFTVTFRFQRNSLKEAFLSRWNQERHDFWQQSPVGEAANKWHEIIRQEGWDKREAKVKCPSGDPSPWPSHFVLWRWISSRVIRVHKYQRRRAWRILLLLFYQHRRYNNILHRYGA